MPQGSTIRYNSIWRSRKEWAPQSKEPQRRTQTRSGRGPGGKRASCRQLQPAPASGSADVYTYNWNLCNFWHWSETILISKSGNRPRCSLLKWCFLKSLLLSHLCAEGRPGKHGLAATSTLCYPPISPPQLKQPPAQVMASLCSRIQFLCGSKNLEKNHHHVSQFCGYRLKHTRFFYQVVNHTANLD